MRNHAITRSGWDGTNANRRKHLLPGVALAVAALAPGAPVLAEGDFVIEEIVVTATKRASRIQDVPFSINAQTQEDIDRTGASNLEELSRNVAGLTVQNLGPGQSQVAIRGVSAGQIVRDQPGVKEQVGIYVDESVISLSLFTPDLDLYDLNRVETLRGPQGTLFGSGSVGGTIRYITNSPQTEEFEGSIEVSANSIADGSDGEEVRGYINIPLVEDRSAIRIVGYKTSFGGFVDARTEGGGVIEDVNEGGRKGIRMSALLKPTDNITITPRFIRQRIETDGFNRQEVFNLFANPHTTTRPAIQLGEREQHLLLREGFDDDTLIADVTVELAFDRFDVTLVSSLIDRDILVSRDASALTGSVSVDLGFLEDGVLLPSNLLDTTELEQDTQEARISSKGDTDLNWVVGYFHTTADRVYAQSLPTPLYNQWTDFTLGAGTSASVSNGYGGDTPFNSDLPYDLEQSAIFGEFTWALNDRTNLTVGGRFYDYEESRLISSGGLFANGDSKRVDRTSADGFTPRILVDYMLNEDITLNAGASQGFRLGGVNDPLNGGLCDPGDLVTFGSFQAYEDETVWNYEAGVKGRLAGGISINAAVFYADLEDLQVTLDAGSCSSRISFNVPEAHTAGVEVELRAQPAEGLDLSVAGSFLQSEFDSTVRDSTGAILGGVKEGNRLASVPEFQFAATATYRFDIGYRNADGFVSATLHHVGDRITQPGDQVAGAGNFTSGLAFAGATGNEVTTLDLELDPYTVVNVSAGVNMDQWQATLFIQNLGDENALLSFDRERGGRARLAFRTNQPRTVGLRLRRDF